MIPIGFGFLILAGKSKELGIVVYVIVISFVGNSISYQLRPYS